MQTANRSGDQHRGKPSSGRFGTPLPEVPVRTGEHWFGDAIAFCLTAASCWPHSQEGAILAAGLDHGAIEGDPDRAGGGVRGGRLGAGKVGLRGSINVAFAVLIGVAISGGTSCFQVSWSSENLESWNRGILDA